MRLIDANRLILHLNDFALQMAPILATDKEDVYQAIIDCMEAIDEQPTIVPQIEKNDRGMLEIKYKEVEYVKTGRD